MQSFVDRLPWIALICGMVTAIFFVTGLVVDGLKGPSDRFYDLARICATAGVVLIIVWAFAKAISLVKNHKSTTNP